MTTENWDDFRFILAVIEEGSLNAAARVLGVNHATVLRRVNGFQDRFGIQVFDRASSGYRIRADQTALVEALSALREAFGATERALAGHGVGVRGPVKITSTDSLVATVLPSAVAGLRRHYPELSLELIATNMRLNLGQLDAEVTIRPTSSLPDDLIGERVANLAFAVYGHADYLAEHDPQKPHQWLTGAGPLLRSPPGEWLVNNIPRESVAFSADSFLTLRQLCLQKLGLAFLPCCVVTQDLPLHRMDTVVQPMKTDIWVANHKDLNDVPRIKACRDFLVTALKKKADLLEGRKSATS